MKLSGCGVNTFYSPRAGQTIYHSDFRDLCSLLNENEVEYVIVGGFAVAFHGAPRFTGDLDLLIRPESQHVGRALAALGRFGFDPTGVSPEYLLSQAKILQLGNVPVQIHIMTAITGLSWADAWTSREPGLYGDIPVFFIGSDALVRNKRAAGRPKDLADIAALRRKGST